MTWDDHKKNFARLARDGGYTIAQYAAEFNLNPNTARRYLRAFKEDTRTADSRKPNKPVRKPLKSMIIDHANDQRAGDHIVAEMAEKQRVNAVVSAAVENAKRQNKRINDRSDDHDVITRAHRTLRDRLERDTLDDDGERFEFEAGDYLIDNVEARKAARAMLRRSGADVLETTLLEKSLSHLLMLENARDTCIRLVQEMRDQQKDDDEGTPPEYRIASMLNSCSAQISSLINTIYSIRNNYRKESREAEKHALSMGQAGIVKLAYERKRENNWSVLEAAEFIEAHGGKVPPLMLEQIKALLRPIPMMRKTKQHLALHHLKIWIKSRENGPPAAALMPHCGLSIVEKKLPISSIQVVMVMSMRKAYQTKHGLNRIWTKTRRKTKKLPANCTGMMINGQKLRNGPTLARACGAISL